MDNLFVNPCSNHLLAVHIAAAQRADRQAASLLDDAGFSAESSRAVHGDMSAQSIPLLEERDAEGSSLRHKKSLFTNIFSSLRKKGGDREAQDDPLVAIPQAPGVYEIQGFPDLHDFDEAEVLDICLKTNGDQADAHEDEEDPVVFTDPFKTPPVTPVSIRNATWSPPLSPLSRVTNSPDRCELQRPVRLRSKMKSLQILGPEAKGAISEKWAKENTDREGQY